MRFNKSIIYIDEFGIIKIFYTSLKTISESDETYTRYETKKYDYYVSDTHNGTIEVKLKFSDMKMLSGIYIVKTNKDGSLVNIKESDVVDYNIIPNKSIDYDSDNNSDIEFDICSSKDLC
jgi:uncharacterized protein with FMN-binding domain